VEAEQISHYVQTIFMEIARS